jgi:acetylornithine aminotransferase
MQFLMPTYGRNPVAFSHGEGAWLWDTDGKRYLDGIAGIATALRKELSDTPGVIEIRNDDMMIAIELECPCVELTERGFDAGLLINVTAETVVRLVPPVIMTDKQARSLVDGVSTLITTFCNAQLATAN